MKTLEIRFMFKTTKQDIKNFVYLDMFRRQLFLHPDFQKLHLDIISQLNCYSCSGNSIQGLHSPYLCFFVINKTNSIRNLNTQLNQIWRQLCKSKLQCSTNVLIRYLTV